MIGEMLQPLISKITKEVELVFLTIGITIACGISGYITNTFIFYFFAMFFGLISIPIFIKGKQIKKIERLDAEDDTLSPYYKKAFTFKLNAYSKLTWIVSTNEPQKYEEDTFLHYSWNYCLASPICTECKDMIEIEKNYKKGQFVLLCPECKTETFIDSLKSLKKAAEQRMMTLLEKQWREDLDK